MRKINRPTVDAAAVFPDCLVHMRNGDLKNRISYCLNLIIQAEREFESKITKGEVYTIVRETLVNSNVRYDELRDFYTNQMVQRESGRKHYDNLLDAAPGGLCPLCSHREATTLDHYLPKAKYPRLSIVPINLVPSCRDCNTGKLAEYPNSANEETLHPYFDDLESTAWLCAEINRTNPVSVVFSVDTDVFGNELLTRRAESHMNCFDLYNLYGIQAGRRLSGMKNNLLRMSEEGVGQAGIARYLKNEADSLAAVNLNSWETAMYRALSESVWFCTVGFELIA